MSLIKVVLLIWYSSMKKKIGMIWMIFDIENWLCKSEICIFHSIKLPFNAEVKCYLIYVYGFKFRHHTFTLSPTVWPILSSSCLPSFCGKIIHDWSWHFFWIDDRFVTLNVFVHLYLRSTSLWHFQSVHTSKKVSHQKCLP